MYATSSVYSRQSGNVTGIANKFFNCSFNPKQSFATLADGILAAKQRRLEAKKR